MRRVMAALSTLALCLLLPIGYYITVTNRSAAPPEPAGAKPEKLRSPSIFDGEDAYTDGRWFLLPDGRLADLADGRVYVTDLDFRPFDRIETDGDRLLADGKPVQVYRAKVYPKLNTLNSEYETLRARFPDAVIAAVSTLHLAAVSGGHLYTFTDDGTLSVVRVDWNLYSDERTLFEQICLLYDHPDELFSDDRCFVFDGGDISGVSILPLES